MQKTHFSFCALVFLLGCFLLAACGGSEPVVLSGENIICFGDSLTYGTGAGRNKSYPAQLSEMIKKPVINAGIPGNTTTDALERLETDVLDRSPRIVLITLGGNDMKKRVNKETAFKNLKEIVEAIQARGALVVVGGVKLLFWDRGYEAEYEKLAEETGALLIPNVLKGLVGHDDLMSDPIHPNAAGYTIMAERFHKAIEPYL
ncbi:arylesterase [Thermodesulfobacteriota bacterium]